MSETTTTNQAEGDVLPPETGVDRAAEADLPTESFVDPDDSPDNPDDDTEEVEHEGAKYRVPKALKGALMMHADYTRKTQEVAEARRATEAREAEVRQVIERQQAFISEVAGVQSIERQLSQYHVEGQPVDWGALRAFDAQNGTTHAQDALILQTQLENARRELFTKMHQREQDQQRGAAKLIEERDAVLARDVRGWSPEMRGKLEELAGKFGFSKDELNTSDARAFKILHRLYQGEQAISREMKARSLQAAASTQPAKTVKGGASSAPDPDKMTVDEWRKWRDQQVADASKQRRRA